MRWLDIVVFYDNEDSFWNLTASPTHCTHFSNIISGRTNHFPDLFGIILNFATRISININHNASPWNIF